MHVPKSVKPELHSQRNRQQIIFQKCSLPFNAEWVLVQFLYNTKLKVNDSRNRLGVAQRVPGGLGSQISWHSAREGGEVVTLTYRPPLPPGMFMVLIFTRGWVDPRDMEMSEGVMSLKNPVTPPGINPGTVRLVVQRLNHYATPGPTYNYYRKWNVQ